MSVFTQHERKVLAALAETLIPGGRKIPPGGLQTADALERYIAGMPHWTQQAARAGVWGIETSAIAYTARTFTKLSLERRTKLLAQWDASSPTTIRHAMRSLIVGLKSVHFDNEASYEMIGAQYSLPPAAEEHPRWLAQVTDGRTVRDDETVEADVVIVGTGAGGAPLAYELALRGHAVLMLEEGKYWRRHEFNGHASEMTRKMYRSGGMTVAFGNISAPVWAGVTVGGTTTVNSGTCYRTPERTLRRWREDFGLAMFSSDTLDPYFSRVEKILGIAPGRQEYLGGVARVVARGSEALGYVHGPLRRNAPDCDGQGLCCFGCPTGAKRSTDVSYVPMALERSAALYSSTRVHKILVENGKAQGVVAKTRGGATITVRARATVIAGGSLMTPLLLNANGLANSSGMVGKNLSIHPAGAALALFDEQIDMHRGIPQGYAVEQFAEEGIMLEGASTPIEITAIPLTLTGRRFVEVMEDFRNLALFGFVIQDTSRGRVVAGPDGHPLIFYNANERDTRAMQRALEAVCKIFFAAGAKSVFPCVHGFDELRSLGDLERLHRHRLHAGDFEISAYHPLGTARMGTDPRSSVVGPDHQTHDVRDLYIVDGSAVPSSLGVNPQVTIMALATRAAEILDRRLSNAAHAPGDARDALGVRIDQWSGRVIDATANEPAYDAGVAGKRGHVESYFIKLNSPDSTQALWLKWTVFAAPHSTARAELWAVVFKRGAPARAFKQSTRLEPATMFRKPFAVDFGSGVFDARNAEGAITSGASTIAWRFALDATVPSLRPFPYEWMYRAPFPETKLTSPIPDAIARGSFEIDGTTVDVTGWRGMQGHNWGPRHTHRYAWCHAGGFEEADDVVLEAFAARLQRGGFELPWLTMAFVWIDGGWLRFDRPAEIARAKSTVSVMRWMFALESGQTRLEGEVSADPRDAIGLHYANPSDPITYCLNSKLATVRVVLAEGTRRRTLTTRRAAFELGWPTADHGIAMGA